MNNLPLFDPTFSPPKAEPPGSLPPQNWVVAIKTQLVITAAVVMVFGGIVNHSLLTWDDDFHLTENPYLNPLTLSSLLHFWQEPYEGLYIPISYSLFAAETALADLLSDGERPVWVYKIGSLTLHTLCSLLVFGLLRRWTGAIAPALIGSLFFAIHPLQVEAVAWTSETRGLLAALFSLAALTAYGWFRDAQESVQSPATLPPRPAVRWYVLATVCLVLGLLSKPSAIFVVPAAAALDVLLFRRSIRDIAVAMGPWVVLAIGDVLLTKVLQPNRTQPFIATWPQRIIIVSDALAFYLQKLVWPVGLTMDYGRTPSVCLADRAAYFTPVIPGILLGMLWWLRAPRLIWLAAALFVLGLAPVLGLVPFAFQAISTVGDRYAYPAMLGAALMVAWAWSRVPRPVLRTLMLILILGLGWAAHVQTRYWRNNDALYRRAVALNPRSWLVSNNQGSLLAHAGDYPAAMHKFRASLDARPDYGKAVFNLGVCHLALGQPSQAHAEFEQAVKLSPDDPKIHTALAESFLTRREPGRAEEHFSAALALQPENVLTLNQLANLKTLKGDFDAAYLLLQRCVQLQPDFWPARVNLGNLLIGQNETEAAEREWRTALTLNPELPTVHFNLGILAARQGRLEEAQAHLIAAREKTHDEQEGRAARQELTAVTQQLGIRAIDTGQFSEAVTLLQQTIALAPGSASAHFHLGRSLAALKQTSEARQAFEKAAQLVPADSQAAADIAAALRALPQQKPLP